MIASLSRTDFVGPFQEAIRSRYAILRPEATEGLVLAQGLVLKPAGEGVIWRFHDADEDWRWRVSLGPDFVALETIAYSSREDFFERFGEVLGALRTHARPNRCQRLGVRYINRITGDEMADLARLIRPEVVGIAATPFSARLNHSLCESSFTAEDARLTTRWGLVPPQTTTDPGAIEPLGERSWVLDLDMSTDAARDFDASNLAVVGRSFAETIYGFFRWSVTDELLRRRGGRV